MRWPVGSVSIDGLKLSGPDADAELDGRSVPDAEAKADALSPADAEALLALAIAETLGPAADAEAF